MRNVRLCTQALSPDGRALAFCRLWGPRGFKVVIVNYGDFVLWWPDFPENTLVVGRWYGPRNGDVDGYPWDGRHAQLLADEQAACRDAGNWRVDVWECINEPVVGSADDMKRLNEFELRWVEIMHSRGMKTCVGNIPRGNPPEDEGISWMKYFRPAIEMSDYFGYHGYGYAPKILDGKEYLLFRHRKLLKAAGLPNHPTLLTEFGLDQGGCEGCGYRTRLTDEEMVRQLIQADQELRTVNDPAQYAFYFCHGTFGSWWSFDLTDQAATMLGQYIKDEGDEEAPPPDGDDMYINIWRRDLPGGPVHRMEREAYSGGVVCSEMYCDWMLEALKVQAVAARGYVTYHQEHGGKHAAQGAILCTEECCQMYRESNITDKSVQAVTETRGIVLLDAGNKVIQPEYISKCGMPECPHCRGRPGHDDKMWPGRMCQYGAKVFAEIGKSWREILHFFYPHAHLSDESPDPPPPDEDVGEWLMGFLDKHLPPWHEDVEYNPETALTRAARNAEPPLGLAISKELRKPRDGRVVVYQYFFTGLTWCWENDYANIWIRRY